MNNFQNVLEKLKNEKVEYELLHVKSESLDVDSHVKALGIQYKEGMSTLLFKTDRGDIFAFLRRDDRNIDMKFLKKHLNTEDVKFCDDADLEKVGFEPGLVSPILLKEKGIRVLVDSMVDEMDFVVCGTTDPYKALKIDKDSLYKLLGEYELVEASKPNMKRQDAHTIVNSVDREGKAVKNPRKKRILTGDTPTGNLHIGHYIGSLENRVKLQNEYETYIILANIHAYANYYQKAEMINENVYGVLLDNLAVGIDPNVSTIFLESAVPEIYELYTFFLTMVKHARALRNPTIKEELEYKFKKEEPAVAFITYPILQTADILAFNADIVPVGEDQFPVIEQAREIARDFNSAYGDLFVEPEGVVGRVPRLVGTDGDGKMSKSKGNVILLSDTEEDLKKKVMGMYTDPNRIHATDPGQVENNPVFIYHEIFNKNTDEVADLKERYQKGRVGDVEVKTKLFDALNEFLAPIRERRKYYEDRPEEAKEILAAGTNRARETAKEVVKQFREKVGVNSLIG